VVGDDSKIQSPVAAESEQVMAMTKQDILDAGNKANDQSSDWRDWSAEKCERERANNPELDQYLRDAIAPLTRAIEQHNAQRREVNPKHTPGKVHDTAFYALLAREFNMRPDEVSAMTLPEIRGLVEAWKQTHGVAAGSNPIALKLAVKKYHVAESTLRTRCTNGELADLRPAGHAKNAALILDENQIAARYPKK